MDDELSHGHLGLVKLHIWICGFYEPHQLGWVYGGDVVVGIVSYSGQLTERQDNNRIFSPAERQPITIIRAKRADPLDSLSNPVSSVTE